MPKLTANTKPYQESLLESLKNPDEAAHYLNACLEDDDARVFLLALRDVAEAHGGITALSRTAHLNRGKPLSDAFQVRQSISGQPGCGLECMRSATRGSVYTARPA